MPSPVPNVIVLFVSRDATSSGVGKRLPVGSSCRSEGSINLFMFECVRRRDYRNTVRESTFAPVRAQNRHDMDLSCNSIPISLKPTSLAISHTWNLRVCVSSAGIFVFVRLVALDLCGLLLMNNPRDTGPHLFSFSAGFTIV